MRDVDDEVANPKKKIWKKKFDFMFQCGNKKHKVHGKIGI